MLNKTASFTAFAMDLKLLDPLSWRLWSVEVSILFARAGVRPLQKKLTNINRLSNLFNLFDPML